MTESAEKFVGSIPEYYDRGLGPVMFEPYALATAERVAAISVANVLETAAGTGILTRRLRDKLPTEAEIVATDLNTAMLAVARGKFSDAERVTLHAADAQNLPFADAAFDALCCQFGVMFFPDKPRAYGQARRVLRSGGRFLFSVWDSRAANPFTEVITRVMRQAMPDNPPGFYDTPYGYFAIDPIRAALREAGFAQSEAEALPISASVTSFRGYAEGTALGSPLADQIRARGLEPADLVDAFTDGLEREFGPTGPMPMRAILFTARVG